MIYGAYAACFLVVVLLAVMLRNETVRRTRAEDEKAVLQQRDAYNDKLLDDLKKSKAFANHVRLDPDFAERMRVLMERPKE
jgi:hypothetical protein